MYFIINMITKTRAEISLTSASVLLVWTLCKLLKWIEVVVCCPVNNLGKHLDMS